MSLNVGKIFAIGQPQAVAGTYQLGNNRENFAKNTFNFANADLTHPNHTVSNSPLGDPDKAAYLDILA